MSSKVIERFLGYIKVDTRSDENSTTFPSTAKQKNLAKILAKEFWHNKRNKLFQI